AATPTGAAVFAMRTGAPIVPIFTHRYKDDVHKIIVEKPFYIETKLNDEQAIYSCMEKITRLIESDIRQYPSEWGWFHRRWKTQPKDIEEHKNEI
ncbi:MAG: lysophospholipid acyltransferase family protein, partial [Candidatus Omnitrophica bacterium]|nr:lysophospholipid acyltransferase family protein [Candidatus Omnitrophota bacterium]